jgi:K+-transporting ATPase ATPase A chain
VSGTVAGLVFLALLILALAVVHVPLGDYMYRVYSSRKHSRTEKFIYRLIGANPDSEQTWKTYARSVLAFSAVSVVFLFVLQLVQDKLPLHLHDPATKMTPALAWNTAVSFVTNTNWQNYSGESTMGHLVQMAGLTVQNFVSAAVGMAVAVALVRGFARHRSNELGNFWVDLTRGTELSPQRPGRQHAGRYSADHPGRTGRQPGGDQRVGHQRRWLLQRQLIAPI